MPDFIGVYHKDDPDHMVWKFNSIAAFRLSFDHGVFTLWKCDKVFKKTNEYKIPHEEDSNQFTYILRPIPIETYANFGAYPSLTGQVLAAFRTGAPMPQFDPSQQECETCHQIKPLTAEYWKRQPKTINFRPNCSVCINSVATAKAIAYNKRQRDAKKDDLGPFFCRLCFVMHDGNLRHGTDSDQCNQSGRVDALGVVDTGDRRKAFGLFRIGDDETMYYVFKSRDEFFRAFGIGNDDEFIKKRRWNHVMLLEGVYYIPHEDGKGSTYYLKPIDDETAMARESDEEMLELVKSNVRRGLELPLKIVNTRACIQCGVVKELNDSNFENLRLKYRSVCRECRVQNNAQNHWSKYEELQEVGEFFCVECKVMHPIEERLVYRNCCKAFHAAQSKIRLEENKITKEEAISRGIVGKQCDDCKIDFSIDQFVWKGDRWKNLCHKCDYASGRCQRWRAYQRELDEEGWKRHCAEQSQKFRDANPEKMKEYYAKYAKDPSRRMEIIQINAGKRGILFAINDKKKMMQLVGRPCTYCGSENTDFLNGLDRLDSDPAVGYCVGNVVPCCTMCNFTKGTQKPEEFVSRMARVIQNVNLSEFFTEEQLPEVPEWKPFDVRRRETEGYNLRKSGAKEKKNHYGQCYLCHYNGIVGWDRVDSFKSYDDEGNVRSCCTTCNLSKRELDLRTFYDLAVRITQKHSGLWNAPVFELDSNGYNSEIGEPNEANRGKRKERTISRPSSYGWKVYLIHGDQTRTLMAKYPETTKLQMLTQRSRDSLHKACNEKRPITFDKYVVERITRFEYNNDQEVSEPTEDYIALTENMTHLPPKKKRKMDDQGQIILRHPETLEIVGVFRSANQLASVLNIHRKSLVAPMEKGFLKSFWIIERGDETIPCPPLDNFLREYAEKSQLQRNQYSK